MKLDSIYFNMLRAKPKQKYSSPNESNVICCHAGCSQMATHRAPKVPQQNHPHHMPLQWHRFCKTHVVPYNQSYDYFANMSAEEVLNFIQSLDIGHRPTWRLGGRGPRLAARTHLRDYFQFFDKKQKESQAYKRPAGAHKALDILGLEENASTNEIKSRFKMLVKKYHPDLNGGERKYEQQLSAVIQSYKELKKRLAVNGK